MAKRAKMGRPVVYNTPRRPRLLQLSDELWQAIDEHKGDRTHTEFIEAKLRETLGLPPLSKP